MDQITYSQKLITFQNIVQQFHESISKFISPKTFQKYKKHYTANSYSFGLRNDNKSRSQQFITDLNSPVTNLYTAN